MKGKVLLIAGVAVLGIGVATHISGHAPKCLLGRAIKAGKPAVTAKSAIVPAVQADQHQGSDGTVKMDYQPK